MARAVVVTVGLILVAVVAVLGYRFVWGPDAESTTPTADGAADSRADADDAQLPPSAVMALGRIEPASGMIEIAGTAGDRVLRLCVEEGQEVEPSHVLAELESLAARQAQVDLAAAQLQEASAIEAAELAYADSSIAEAEAALGLVELQELDIAAQRARRPLLEANLRIARDDLARLEGLGSEIVSPQELEHQRLLVQQAEAELASAEALLERLVASLEINRAQADAKLATARLAKPRISAASQSESLRLALKLAEAQRDASIIRAPRRGKVLRILTRAGEALGAKPLLLLADTREMVVVAEVFENHLRHVRRGMAATITSHALAAPLSGTVEQIGTLVGDHQVASLNPAARADLRVVNVVIKLDAASTPAAAAMVRLQVDVRIPLPEP
jgi:HlyD family secretion protein